MNVFKYQNLFLPFLILYIIFVAVYINLSTRRKKLLQEIYDPHILQEIIPPNLTQQRNIKDALIISSLFFIVLSILGPQWGIEYREKPVYSANIAFIVDTSLSMSAKDIKPSRIESVKLTIKSLIENLKGYRITIIAFQDKAYIQCPLTDDTDAILYFVDILKPNMLPYPGTNIADAISTTNDYLENSAGEKIAILFTDGEDHSGKINDALAKIVKNQIKFITIGIGTSDGDILYDEDKREPKKGPGGKTVITRLDEKTLIHIANSTEGKYIRYTTPEYVVSEIKEFIRNRDISLTKEKEKNYKNRYQYFLIIGLLLILVEFIMMEIPKQLIVIFLILSVSNFSPLNLFSFDPITDFKAEKANRLYLKNDYEKSFEIYKKINEKNPKNEKVKYNMANSLYKLKKYDEAIEVYNSIKDKKIISKSLYNSANAFYMKDNIEKAIEYYKKAIIADPKNEDAKYNLELILKQKNSSNSSSNSSKDKNQNNSKDNQNKENNQNKDKNSQEDKNSNENEKKEKKQAEKFLEMIKNMERESMKKATQQQNLKGDIKNEFDW